MTALPDYLPDDDGGRGRHNAARGGPDAEADDRGTQVDHRRTWVRDEEVVGSNPATPTEKVQVKGPATKIGGRTMIVM